MKFSLYHGCQNTFVLTKYKDGLDYSKIAYELCHKFNMDGFIAAKDNPLEMVFYNADGTRAPMCGNGIRCLVKFLVDSNMVHEDEFDIQTLGGVMKVQITSHDPFFVKINFGKPDFSSEKLSIDTKLNEFINQKIEANGNIVTVSAVFLGTHHAVIFVDDINKNLDGESICNHPIFLKKINVNFVQVINKNKIFVKTFERGVGWTKACGSGASSSFVISRLFGLVNNKVEAQFIGGTVYLSEDNNKSILMEGPAEKITEYEI